VVGICFLWVVLRGDLLIGECRFPERQHLTSSGRDAHEVFDTPIGKVGLLICWDLAFPEAFRELIAQGAKIVIIPTFCKTLCSVIFWFKVLIHF
jgi:predicted amidohydrolase